MTVQVRPMEQGDLEPVGTLAEALVKLHHSYDSTRFFLEAGIADGYRAYFKRELGKPGVVLLVATLGTEIAGYVYGSLEKRDWAKLLDAHGAIHDIYVSETARRQGVAQALMRAAVETFSKLGATQIVLSTAVLNTQGLALFKSLGFRPTMLELTLDKP